MAHFAELDENNIVLRVVVVNNDVIQQDGVEKETLGIDFCKNLFGGNWIQTSYNGNFRKQYAQPGFTYNSVFNIFLTPPPYLSWSLDQNGDWQPPTPKPTDAPEPGYSWTWQESTLSWVQTEKPRRKNN